MSDGGVGALHICCMHNRRYQEFPTSRSMIVGMKSSLFEFNERLWRCELRSSSPRLDTLTPESRLEHGAASMISVIDEDVRTSTERKEIKRNSEGRCRTSWILGNACTSPLRRSVRLLAV
ncbi:hypothetical protein NEOLEDRAFT_505496 [Neolentinus lepideus HHB14362 ss-1]|uniref:Uncharacterized protein n=1 Tax=Neolentinus lepideus HHB14362 ss-1 TaxID=1314782 RepID=A0A165RJD3_9AGAM|nr:hypothetical protein NEOLEDRAFT_505496 [Neolentinus lepideus HHB14362 ss-1]